MRLFCMVLLGLATIACLPGPIEAPYLGAFSMREFVRSCGKERPWVVSDPSNDWSTALGNLQ